MSHKKAKLQKMAEVHIKYEVTNLLRPFYPPDFFVRASSPAVENNAREWLGRTALESALIHMRVLTAFLVGERTKPDEVIAPDYFGGKWDNQPKFLFRTDPTATDEVNKQNHVDFVREIHTRLAHLSIQRVEEDFNWSEITAETPVLLAAFAGFVQDLATSDHPERAEWFSWFLVGAAGAS